MSYTPTDLKDPETSRELRRIAEEFNAIGKMRVFHREPEKAREGFFCICDGTDWNPLGDGIKRPVWFNGVAWSKFDV